ncbi:MAG: D-alanine--D-alanine ligase family protein [Actinomycetota bacterium]
MTRLGVLLLYGGRSAEHEVSCVSARHVAAFLDPGRYQVLAVGITKQGAWVLPAASEPVLLGEALDVPDEAFVAEGSPVALVGQPGRCRLLSLASGGEEIGPDLGVVFPVLHGPYGEDGTLQGLLELADLPYVGSGVASSAVGMDKRKMKVAFQAEGIPMAPWRPVYASAWRDGEHDSLRSVEEIGFPCFVKPAGLGSSVGVSKCSTAGELAGALELAFTYDPTALVEEAISGREIECAVLGNESPVASVCGEIIHAGEFYDYESKYLDSTSEAVIPASIPGPVCELVRSYSLQAFKAVDAAGLSRIDFFYEEGRRGVLINEINTMPGFTTISMYPKLWEASGIAYGELLDRLVDLALERYRSKPRPVF